MARETKKSYCRLCHAYCAIDVGVENNKIVDIRGDASNPVYGGYTCLKGRQLAEAHNHPDRVRQPLRRRTLFGSKARSSSTSMSTTSNSKFGWLSSVGMLTSSSST